MTDHLEEARISITSSEAYYGSTDIPDEACARICALGAIAHALIALVEELKGFSDKNDWVFRSGGGKHD